MKRNVTNKLLLLLIAVVSIPTFATLLRPGYFPMHDDMQAMRLLQMDKCISDLQIPCRWVPDMGYGYGYPQFNYYAPLPYYIMEGFHLLGFGFLDAVKASFVLSVLLSGIGMYLLGSSLWGKMGGFLSAIFYVYAPYRAVDMYVRGAVGEFWGLVFMPFILWSVKKTYEGDKRAILWVALSSAALFTSHNITTLIFMPVIGIFTLLLFFTDKNKSERLGFKKIKNVSFGLFWGFLLSAFFVLPAFFEKDLVHIETLTQGYFNYLAHFASVSQLLFSNFWGYGSSELGPYDGMSLSVGILHLVFSIVSLIALIAFRKWKKVKIVLFFTTLGFFVFIYGSL